MDPHLVDISQVTIKAEPDLDSSINQIRRYINAALETVIDAFSDHRSSI